jgi:hypothetical protein
MAHSMRHGNRQLPRHRAQGFSGNRVDRVFFEKKNQKTFACLLAHRNKLTGHREASLKVFWFFFSKKNCFLNTCLKVLD